MRPPSECIQPTSTRAQANLTLQGTVVIVVRAIPSDLIIEFPSRLLLPVPTFPPSSPPARVSAPAAAPPLGSRSMRPQATALAVAHTFRGRAHFEARRSRRENSHRSLSSNHSKLCRNLAHICKNELCSTVRFRELSRLPPQVCARHHCRSCGNVVCGACSLNRSCLPEYGIIELSRVCDACFFKA